MAKLQAEGRATRKGVPDGYSGRREEVAELKAACAAEAKEIVQLMVDKNILSPDDEKANEAIEYAVAVVRDPTIEHRMRLVAAKTVLDFTKAKPASTTKVELAKAEDFLAALAAEIK